MKPRLKVYPRSFTTGRMALMCSGPEAQHPPIIRAPIRFQLRANSAIREGVYSAFYRTSGPELDFSEKVTVPFSRPS